MPEELLARKLRRDFFHLDRLCVSLELKVQRWDRPSGTRHLALRVVVGVENKGIFAGMKFKPNEKLLFFFHRACGFQHLFERNSTGPVFFSRRCSFPILVLRLRFKNEHGYQPFRECNHGSD